MIFTNMKLSDLCVEISYGYTASATENNTGCKFLRITDIQGGYVDWDKVPFCEIESKDITKYQLIEGDIVIARTGNSTGENFIFQGKNNAVFASYLIRYRVNKEIANPYYIWLNLRSSNWWGFVSGAKSGSAQAGANAKVLGAFEIPIPDLQTQNKIADFFQHINNKIQLNTQINQTLEQIAQALFKSWFVDFDPVRAKVQALSDGMSLEQAELAAMQAISGKTPEELTALSQTQPDCYAELAETAKAFPCEMVEVDGVEVPKGWNLKALDKIANYQNGLALQKFRPEDDEPFLPVVKIAQLRQGYADGEEKAKASIKPECIIDNGDVIFSWSGSLLVDIWCGGKAALNQHLFKVTSKRYPKWFYYFYTKYHLAEFQRIAYDKAVTMGHIKREHLSAAKCIVPNDELLANKTLENILEKIIFNRLENFNLQNTRDLLFPRFLNGDIKK